MKTKIVTLALLFAILFLGGVAMLLGNTDVSKSERRPMTQWEDLSKSKISNGSFMQTAEDAAMDQFPFRDQFRSLKAGFLYNILGQLDNNNVYIHNGNAGRLDYPLNETSVKNAINKIQSIQKTYLAGKNTKVYYCVIPDKNYYLAQELGYPTMDYNKMLDMLSQQLNMKNISIFHLLNGNSYYRTDPHWNQAALLPVAEYLTKEMGHEFTLENTVLEDGGTLAGAYLGQSALPLEPDALQYWNGGILAGWRAQDLTTRRPIAVYDFNGLAGDDPYDFFLGGANPLQVIENPKASTDRELIIFRDSFGSSIAPLFAGTYRKVTLVDTRYVHSSLLGNYIRFNNQDVLFLYSTLVLNESTALQ